MVLEVDEAQLARALRRQVVERLRLFALFSCGWALLHGAALTMISGSPPAWMWMQTIAFAVAAAVTYVMARRPLGVHTLNALGVGIGIWELALIAQSARIADEIGFFWVTPLVLVAAGVVLLHRAWLVGYLVAGIGYAFALGRLENHAVSTDIVVMGSAAVTSLMLHEVGRRFTVRIEVMRQRDEQQRAALERLLADLRTQLADRQQAEAEGARLREQLTQAQKMEAIGTLAGGFAHDMNNVLGGILGIAEMLRDDLPEQYREDLDGVIESTKRGAELTRNLVGFARRGKYRKERVVVETVVDDMLRLLTRTLPKGIVFGRDLEEPSPLVEGDPALLTQALVNLCLNSADAMRGVGNLGIAARTVTIDAERALALGLAPGRYAMISVTDTGSGMDAETQRRVFEPFFTTKAVGRGTGLGLPMVYSTVQAYGGAVELDSTVGVGTRISMYLPADASATEAPRRPSQPLAQATHAATILCVDDDDQVRRLARRVLTASGYQVLEARDGQEALAVYAENPGIALVVLDMSMPVLGGAECFRALRLRDPLARVLLVSGYTLEEDAQSCLEDGALGFVDKPYSVESLTDAVAQALRKTAPRGMSQRVRLPSASSSMPS